MSRKLFEAFSHLICSKSRRRVRALPSWEATAASLRCHQGLPPPLIQEFSPPTNILPLLTISKCSKSLDNHRRQSLTVVKSHQDLRMPALQLFGFNLTDSMTASPHSLTSVKQAENCLHSRGHCKSRRQTEKSCRLVGRNPCERVTTAVYGLADGWELTGSVEGQSGASSIEAHIIVSRAGQPTASCRPARQLRTRSCSSGSCEELTSAVDGRVGWITTNKRQICIQPAMP